MAGAGMVLRAALLAAVLGAVVSCRAKPKNFDNENDELRRRLDATQVQVDMLRAENTELKGQLAEAGHRLEAAGQPPSGEVVSSIPRCAGVRFGKLTGIDIHDPNRVIVYLIPYDGRQRFVQVAGHIAVDLTLLDPDPGGEAGSEPKVLGSVALGPVEVREAYRSTMLSTHYAVDVTLTEPLGRGRAAVLRAKFDDAVTGLSHEAHLVVVGE